MRVWCLAIVSLLLPDFCRSLSIGCRILARIDALSEVIAVPGLDPGIDPIGAKMTTERVS